MLLLHDYFGRSGRGEVFAAPTDVILTHEDVFVPDLVVVRHPQDVTERAIEAPPLLVVEILSPSTRKQDRGIKAERYAELGVEHFWIVDPDARQVECSGSRTAPTESRRMLAAGARVEGAAQRSALAARRRRLALRAQGLHGRPRSA